MKPLRSMLFVPGNKPAWMEKALGYGADALIFDLEDAVPVTDKAAARPMVREALEQFHNQGPSLTVRINALETGMSGDDLEAIVSPGLSAIVAPKVETPQDIATLDTLLAQCEQRAGMAPGQIEIFPTLETAKGIYHAYPIAICSPRVPTLIGTAGKGGDTARSLGYIWSKQATETLHIRSKVLLEARAAACAYPLIASWFDITDLDGLRDDVRLNRQIGYTGQVVIHPSHVPEVNDIFTPTAEEIAHYQGLLTAMQDAERRGTAAVTYAGGMVDIAMVKTAQQVLTLARQIGVID
ncbi:MAG: CoA ester lyase [Candidatus Tectomicrobia bacterium]